eukprot:sb/3478349/
MDYSKITSAHTVPEKNEWRYNLSYPLFVFDCSRLCLSITETPLISFLTTNNITVSITSIKILVSCSKMKCDWPLKIRYTLGFQTQTRDTLKGKTLPCSRLN